MRRERCSGSKERMSKEIEGIAVMRYRAQRCSRAKDAFKVERKRRTRRGSDQIGACVACSIGKLSRFELWFEPYAFRDAGH